MLLSGLGHMSAVSSTFVYDSLAKVTICESPVPVGTLVLLLDLGYSEFRNSMWTRHMES